MAKKLGSGIRQALLLSFIFGWMSLILLCSCGPASRQTTPTAAEAEAQFDETNPLGANAGCYVCHITFVKENLSKTHLQAGVTCVRCHGVSFGHANDENIGATPPDVTFKRNQVDVMCLKCHARHDISTKEIGTRKSPPICTDCHGQHRIAQK